MADRIEILQATIPAATTVAAPASALASMPDGILRRIEVTFPDGCAGLVGMQLVYAGAVVAPRSGGGFITGNDRIFPWEPGDLPTGSQWTVRGINSDIYPHTLQVTFFVDELSSSARAPSDRFPVPDTGMLPPVPAPSPTPSPEPEPTPPPEEPPPPPVPPPAGTPPPAMPPPRRDTEMPTCIITDTAGHPTEHFTIWPSGLVRRCGDGELRFYLSHSVPHFGPRSQTEYAWLRDVADAVAGKMAAG